MSKYNLKNITLGIGLGLVLSSAINLNFQNKPLTPDQIKTEAAKYNMIVLDAKDIINSRQILDDTKDNQDDNTENTEGNETPTTPNGNPTVPDSSPQTAPQNGGTSQNVPPPNEAAPKPAAPPPQAQERDTGYAVIDVKRGMHSEDIGVILEEKGIIADSDAFIKKVNGMNIDSQLKTGRYVMKKGISIDAIIKMLTATKQ